MKAKVSIARAGTLCDSMEQSLDMICIEGKLKRGSKVLTKPNLVRTPSKSGWARREGAYELTFAPEGDIVHRESIEALINILLERGVKPENVIVGEAPGGCEAETVFKALGLHEMCEGFGVGLLDLNLAPAQKVSVEDAWVIHEVWIPKVVLQADVRVNLATLKVHGSTVVSLCLKNWGIGIPSGRYYGLNKARGNYRRGIVGPLPIHPEGLVGTELGQEVAVSRLIVDICRAVGYDIGILEGVAILDYSETKEVQIVPSGRRSWRVRRDSLMLASDDMAAIDAVGARLLGLKHSEILHIKWAGERGLGTTDLNEVDIVGEAISDVEMRSNPLHTQTKIKLPSL